ncbi:MAG: VOC family protein, partial [Chloroflexi bacterium]|nr:VOC family protein [Chloroflexota bacterium]
MSTPHSPIGFLEAVCYDVADIDRAAEFWSGLLGCTFGRSTQSGFRRAQLPSGLYFLLQQSDEPKTGKNRAHVDFETDEMEAAVALVVKLGGKALHAVDDVLA